MDYKDLPSLQEYVRKKKDKDIPALKEVAEKWLALASKNRLSYEVEWLGVPIIQTPEDMILMQELIFKIQPDYIVETGIAHGGSLVFYASLLKLLGKQKVIGVDIEIREHNKKVIEAHPLFEGIEIIEGDSSSPETVERIKSMIPNGSKVIVCLDSRHTKEHVAKELAIYKDLVSVGSYLVVFDTHTSRMAELGAADKSYVNNSPMEAVNDFVEQNNNFEIDSNYNKLFISYSPNGYLRRIK